MDEPSDRKRLRVRVIHLLAVGLFLLAVAEIILAGAPLSRSHLTVEGVPVEVLALRGRAGGPAVVLGHGFACAHQIMYGYAYTLAHHGYTVYLLDFSGHGANPRPLTSYGQGTSGPDPLQEDLDAVVRYAAARHNAVAILGHSMGGGAVVRYAATHPGVAATIGISSAGGQVTRDLPRNLLLMAGAWEFPSLTGGSRALLRQAGGAESDVLYGDPARGTARKLVFVPQAEHVLVLFSPRALDEAVAWLDSTFGVQVDSRYVDVRLVWVAIAFLAALVLARPFASWLLKGVTPARVPAVPGPGATVGVFAVSAIGAPLVARLLPDTWVPLAVAGYVANYLAAFGLLTLVGTAFLGYGRAWDVRPWLDWRSLGAVAGMAVYFFLTTGLLGQCTLVPIIPTLHRLPWLADLLPSAFLYFAAGEVLIRSQASSRAALVAEVAHKALTLLSLTVAIFALGAPFFLALLLPLLPVAFVAMGLLGRWLYQPGRNPLIAGLVNALALSVALAALFPLVR